jgi:hypothetical protein
MSRRPGLAMADIGRPRTPIRRCVRISHTRPVWRGGEGHLVSLDWGSATGVGKG